MAKALIGLKQRSRGLAAGWVGVADQSPGDQRDRRLCLRAPWRGFFTSKAVDGADGESPAQLPAAWPHAFELFLDAVAGTQDVALVAAREAADRSAAMEAIYQGARAGAWIEPQYEIN